MVTLGYRNPLTGRESLVEVGTFDEERDGYWVMEIDPDTRESLGPIFLAPRKDLF